MVNDRQEHYDDDESEYQFSDDQINYDVDTESDTASTEPQPLAKKNFFGKLTPYRRMIIGVIVFLVILFIVYLVLSPGSSNAPPTEFVPNSAANPITQKPLATQQPVVPAGKPPLSDVSSQNATPATIATAPTFPQVPTASMPSQSSTPQAPATASQFGSPAQPQTNMPASTQTIASAPNSQESVPTAAMASSTSGVQPQGPTSVPQPQLSNANALPASFPQVSISQPAPTNPPPQAATPASVAGSEVSNKLSALETQNTAMMNAIQTQFAQKIAEYEMQNKMLQERVVELNKRLANMEATINKMAQIIRDGGTVTRTVRVPPRPSPPKVIYAVQAIIPGRAWLKSDTGETVTVAEGDLLKEYGRIIKIDPYDGVVQIDNGNRIITLSYGAGGD